MVGFEAGEWHVIARHQLLRIGQIFVERGRIPDQLRVLHRVGIGEIGDRRGGAADDVGETRTDEILARRQRMTHGAFAEHDAAFGGVAIYPGHQGRAWGAYVLSCRRVRGGRLRRGNGNVAATSATLYPGGRDSKKTAPAKMATTTMTGSTSFMVHSQGQRRAS